MAFFFLWLLFKIACPSWSCLLIRDGGELSTRDLQKMVQALPQYSEQIDKLSLHVEVSFVYTFIFPIFCFQFMKYAEMFKAQSFNNKNDFKPPSMWQSSGNNERCVYFYCLTMLCFMYSVFSFGFLVYMSYLWERNS